MNLRPKKSLGQNFLKSKEALTQIIDACEPSAEDIILEVGPGKGVLTERLLTFAAKVIAVEKDDRLIGLLHEKFSGELKKGRLDLINKDILEFDPEVISFYKDFTYKIVANIPYYITGAFIRKFLTSKYQPESMTLMLQKEVAQRIVARDTKESILSISVKAYGIPKYISTVKAKYFSPEPKVDSAIILISDVSKGFFSDIPEDRFFEIVKLGFAHKRKMLLGNLKEQLSGEVLEAAFQKAGIQKTVRAEDVSLEQWKKLIVSLS